MRWPWALSRGSKRRGEPIAAGRYFDGKTASSTRTTCAFPIILNTRSLIWRRTSGFECQPKGEKCQPRRRARCRDQTKHFACIAELRRDLRSSQSPRSDPIIVPLRIKAPDAFASAVFFTYSSSFVMMRKVRCGLRGSGHAERRGKVRPVFKRRGGQATHRRRRHPGLSRSPQAHASEGAREASLRCARRPRVSSCIWPKRLRWERSPATARR